MRKIISTIFVISALGALVLCSGCVLPQSGKPGENVGFSQVTTQKISPYISFDEVKQKFEEYLNDTPPTEKLPVYYVFSRDIDDTGNAVTWLFGVQNSDRKELLMYDRTGWKIIPWTATIPSEKIPLNQVVSPNTIFNKNKEVIFNAFSKSTPDQRELVLKQGVYTFTINSGSTKTLLKFNATTGALIEKP